MADYAQDVFYYGGRTYAPGDEIEPTSAQDRKSLEERKLIGSDRPEPIKGGVVAEARKNARPAPETKNLGAAPENKAKAKS